MMLLNKAMLSSFGFESPISLLFFQCAVCAAFVRVCGAMGAVKLEPWSFRIARLWFLVNIIFVAMLSASFFALKELGVPMATVLKNLTNLFTICGNYLYFGKVNGTSVWLTLALMTLSAICGAATDLAFSFKVGPACLLSGCMRTVTSHVTNACGVYHKVERLAPRRQAHNVHYHSVSQPSNTSDVPLSMSSTFHAHGRPLLTHTWLQSLAGPTLGSAASRAMRGSWSTACSQPRTRCTCAAPWTAW